MDDTITRLKEVLSYTELSAVKAVFEVLGEEDEKLIVGTNLAAEKILQEV